MDDQVSSAPAPTLPRGIFSGRVDEKGRLKLPAAFQQHLGGKPLFVTTLDRRIGRIYPLSAWEDNEQMLAQETDDPEAADDINFIANVYGADAEMDAQGRLLVPAELRKLLGLENQQVWLDWSRGAVNIYNKQEFDSRTQRAENELAAKVAAFKRKGLK